MSLELASKKTYCHISDKQKKEIYEFAKKNPNYKQHKIANKFINCYPELRIDQLTVSKILKKTDEYQQVQDDVQAKNTFHYCFVKHS
ncbi:1920_t:CDS:1, partial [Cetraspora pellucida]